MKIIKGSNGRCILEAGGVSVYFNSIEPSFACDDCFVVWCDGVAVAHVEKAAYSSAEVVEVGKL